MQCAYLFHTKKKKKSVPTLKLQNTQKLTMVCYATIWLFCNCNTNFIYRISYCFFCCSVPHRCRERGRYLFFLHLILCTLPAIGMFYTSIFWSSQVNWFGTYHKVFLCPQLASTKFQLLVPWDFKTIGTRKW